jgi:hypothetical protein
MAFLTMRRCRQHAAIGGDEAGLLRGFRRRSGRTRLPSLAPAVFQTLSTASPGSVLMTNECGLNRGRSVNLNLPTSRSGPRSTLPTPWHSEKALPGVGWARACSSGAMGSAGGVVRASGGVRLIQQCDRVADAGKPRGSHGRVHAETAFVFLGRGPEDAEVAR